MDEMHVGAVCVCVLDTHEPGPTASGWASGVASTGAAGANVATEASPAGVLARGGVASVSDASAAPSSDVEETSPREGQGLVDDELQSLLVPST